MTSPENTSPAERVYDAVVKFVGAPLVRQLFHAAELSINEGNEGALFEYPPDDPDRIVYLAVRSDRIDVEFQGEGPYPLSLDRALEMLPPANNGSVT